MSTLERWPDGYVLTRDPRREDPLFYYRQEEIWAGAIGFHVLPPYEESAAPEVSISVFVDHLAREQSLDMTDRRRMYVRVIPALAAHHDVWKRVVLRAQDLTEILEGGALGRRLRDSRILAGGAAGTVRRGVVARRPMILRPLNSPSPSGPKHGKPLEPGLSVSYIDGSMLAPACVRIRRGRSDRGS